MPIPTTMGLMNLKCWEPRTRSMWKLNYQNWNWALRRPSSRHAHQRFSSRHVYLPRASFALDSSYLLDVAQAAKLAHRLRYTPAAKAAFKAACVDKGVPTPHNVRRDVKTRWNSTEEMLGDLMRVWEGV